VAIGAVLAVVAVVGAVVLTRPEPAAGEVFLVPESEPGPDPFTTDLDVATPETTAPMSTTAAPTSTTGTKQVRASASGGTPGLYGGTQDKGRCDPDQLVEFLTSHPAKAKAWLAALNGDPTLRWSGGSSVAMDDIEAYVGELTPVTLTVDTRVTNHGYRDGRATSIQAVLQSGTAVMVDAYGVPRVKCACGNPLTRARVVKGGVRYRGTKWPGWNPASVTVVVSSTTVVETYVLVNLSGPGYIARPAGTTGSEDEPTEGPTGGTTTTTTEAASTTQTTVAPSTTAAPSGSFCDTATAWITEYRNWVLAALGNETFGDTSALIAGVDTMIEQSPSPQITADLQALRGFLEAPTMTGSDYDPVALTEYLTGTCHINLED